MDLGARRGLLERLGFFAAHSELTLRINGLFLRRLAESLEMFFFLSPSLINNMKSHLLPSFSLAVRPSSPPL
jgi:hypothetical protein